ncbi:uncharacterized protein B0I36DRAFT_427292 [Microdochium trichocladiopsis]|uniref:C2H2-type domain-containing protein n=1 Tax=Microdochium trichocladiopsis TaxID=1682393 RepID=A0A9P8YJ60_9PEZI|nr:uncharacterized protein B0I36DRAFT_427292 [Microdochium trichocladiopsis]KAH7040988.1 hypothetical protein B0I36DRAFT_427292 [Microdochium trichocladiopsis]
MRKRFATGLTVGATAAVVMRWKNPLEEALRGSKAVACRRPRYSDAEDSSGSSSCQRCHAKARTASASGALALSPTVPTQSPLLTTPPHGPARTQAQLLTSFAITEACSSLVVPDLRPWPHLLYHEGRTSTQTPNLHNWNRSCRHFLGVLHSIRRLPIDEHRPPELSEATEASGSARKIVGLANSGSSSGASTEMRCTLPPHKEPLAFRSYGDYEAHYSKEHVYRCAECHKNLPSAHYLGLHFEECHDPFAAVRRDKGEHTYSCFAEDCSRKCRTPQKRRLHAIDKHMFPKNYFFAVTKEGVDGRSSLLLGPGHHRRKSSGANSTLASAAPGRSPSGKPYSQASRDGEEPRTDPVEQSDHDMEDLTGAMSSLQFVPTSIRFGRSGKRSGFAKR